MEHILDLVQKTNLLQIIGHDNARASLRIRDTSFLHAIQVLLTPAILSFDDWLYRVTESGFHGAQMAAYANNISAPIFIGSQGLDVDMTWLLKNVQFWRHYLVVREETLSPAFEALEAHERPQWWSDQLSQGTREIGNYWKGSYAFVDRDEIRDIRLGRSGQGNPNAIMDQLCGEDVPFDPFQNIDLRVSDPKDVDEWNPAFERTLHSLRTPQSVARTRAQHKDHSFSAVHNFRSRAVRIEGDGSDEEEDFEIEGWLNPLPHQFGVPGWQRLTMMKYFYREDDYGNITDEIDMGALWAYEGVMLPGGKIIVSVKRSIPSFV
jgi:hypothetical protein